MNDVHDTGNNYLARLEANEERKIGQFVKSDGEAVINFTGADDYCIYGDVGGTRLQLDLRCPDEAVTVAQVADWILKVE